MQVHVEQTTTAITRTRSKHRPMTIRHRPSSYHTPQIILVLSNLQVVDKSYQLLSSTTNCPQSNMKVSLLSACLSVLALLSGANAFVPASSATATTRSASALFAKYKTMDEILALFPDDKPVLINFYDANTEAEIKDDIFRAKKLLEDRATLVSIKQQDYPELAKLWDAADKSPAMILFKDGKPVTRIYEETFYLDIVARVGKFCEAEV